MRLTHKELAVRISRRVLWVGEEAYPLALVTRVRPIEVTPNRQRMATTYGRKAGATIGLGVLGLVFLNCAGDALPPAATVLYAVGILAVLAVHTVRLVIGLARPTVWVLSVATAGTARAALASTDKALIHDLSRRVVAAIDNPSVEYAVKVDHIEVVHGDKYGGDRIHGDKILEGGS